MSEKMDQRDFVPIHKIILDCLNVGCSLLLISEFLPARFIIQFTRSAA